MGWQQDGQPIYYEAYTCIQKDFGTCKCNSRNRGMNACLTASAISSDLHWVTMATHPKRPRWRAAGAAAHHWTAEMRCSLPMRSRLDLPDLARASQSFIVSSMDHLPAGPHWPGPNHCNPPASCCRRGQLGAPHHSPPPCECPPTTDGFYGPCCSGLHEHACPSLLWSQPSRGNSRALPPHARPMLGGHRGMPNKRV